MRIPNKGREWQIGRWRLGLTLAAGNLMVGVRWFRDPFSIAIQMPFVLVWFEREGGRHLPRYLAVLRVVVGKQEFRANLALNDWGLGFQVHDTDDWFIQLGPINIVCEYDKWYDDDLYMQPVAHLRLFTRARQPR
jgi:hypothetical protein